jgi:hypothetical protein
MMGIQGVRLEMGKGLLLVVSLMVIMALSVGGCAAPSVEPVPNPQPVPGKSLLESARLLYADSVELEAGETKSIDVTLDTRKDGPGEFSYQVFRVDREYGEVRLPLPDGLEISVEPPSFTANPKSIYYSTITITTTAKLSPGEYWLRLEADFENVFHLDGWIKVSVKP